MSTPNRPTRDINNNKLIVAPEWLSDTASLIFSKLAAELADMRIVTSSDAEALALLADNMSDYQFAAKDVAENGIFSVGDKGQQVRNPSVIIKNTAFKNIQALLPVFGLTPSARASMGIGASAEADPIAEFLSGIPAGSPQDK